MRSHYLHKKMKGIGEHHIEQNKLFSDKYYMFPLIWNVKKSIKIKENRAALLNPGAHELYQGEQATLWLLLMLFAITFIPLRCMCYFSCMLVLLTPSPLP